MRCSIIIPTKDRPAMLAACLEHMREAKGPDDEVIVIDSSAAPHTEYISTTSGVVGKYIHAGDFNQVAAVNFGLKNASGRYIKVFADDDFINGPGHLRSLDIADTHPEVDLFVCGGVKVRTDGAQVTVVCLEEADKYGQTLESIFSWGAFGGGQLVRRETFDKVGVYEDLRICDQEFAARCVAKGLTVRHMRVNTYLHLLYPYSGLIGKREETNAEFNAVYARYGRDRSKIVKGEFLYPPVWDEKVI